MRRWRVYSRDSDQQLLRAQESEPDPHDNGRHGPAAPKIAGVYSQRMSTVDESSPTSACSQGDVKSGSGDDDTSTSTFVVRDFRDGDAGQVRDLIAVGLRSYGCREFNATTTGYVETASGRTSARALRRCFDWYVEKVLTEDLQDIKVGRSPSARLLR